MVASPVGLLQIIADEVGLREVRFAQADADVPAPADSSAPTPLLAETARQLAEYFAGTRQAFELPLAPQGTPFQQRVWAELRQIPYGATTTYAAVARQLGDSLAVRAVGRANATNPLALLVPCHRVIGTGGKLTGFVGGTTVKQWLLRHEVRSTPARGLFAPEAGAPRAVAC